MVAHVVYSFAVGGLENGVVNLINRMPAERWRHAIVALTRIDDGFARRIERPDVQRIALDKPPGQGLWQYPRWWRLFRDLRPAIVHTRNLGALEAQLPAWAAGVPGRVHGEHGWDAADPDGRNRAYQLTRRLYRPFVQQQIALGQELAGYLRNRIGVPAERLTPIYNGVDTTRFAPAGARRSVSGCPFTDPSHFIVGTVGRMQTVKAQPVLARAFVQALQKAPELAPRLRLVLVGDGALRAECAAIVEAAGVADRVWFAGERSDVPDVMRALDCFALPSLAEGISNTILEAMASGLPVLATDVGANAELVQAGQTGLIVPPGDAQAMAQGLIRLAAEPARAAAMGQAGRRAVAQRFSLEAMVQSYEGVYERVLGRRPRSV